MANGVGEISGPISGSARNTTPGRPGTDASRAPEVGGAYSGARLAFQGASSDVILEVWKLCKREICKIHDRQMKHLERWWRQTNRVSADPAGAESGAGLARVVEKMAPLFIYLFILKLSFCSSKTTPFSF